MHELASEVRLAFGLLDLLYRRRLKAKQDAEAVTYSLWADWFEDHNTAATAFAEVLGNDIGRVVAEGSASLLRRAGRVLACSSPVPWPVKQGVYDTVARLPTLHRPLFKGLLGGYHDVYGDLEPTAALALLARLDLPADTPHLAELRSVLAAGHRNHYRSPSAWDSAVRGRTG
ncbi:hypothetical protein [Streptomyces radiopugnans]|uniref:Uncharacterized protein n=1 Tax=Streptomyces radiopugnans TaxID=403935 RepID=A0A1H9KAV0_9ACTN|nr:hypothetical protein [Streptomyces radiopugnans]SEQ96239.1 hypothetical protein SAMN05216481_12222 [Streptomyces radiopugnans]